MQHYGTTFRTFRKNKGYTLKHVAEKIVSVSFLSKFERGDSDISFSTLVELLNRIMVTHEEFYFTHHSGKTNAIEEFFNAAEEAYLNSDLNTITQMKKAALKEYEQTNHVPYHCNVLLLEVYTCMIENSPISVKHSALHILTNYLFDIEVWGYYELRLYNSTLFLLPPNLVIIFSKTVHDKSKSLKKLPVLHKILIRILLNTVTYLTGGQNPDFSYEKETRMFIDYLENSEIPETDLYARVALIQANGYLQIRLNQTAKGIETINRTISIYKELDALELADESAKYLQIMLKKRLPTNN